MFQETIVGQTTLDNGFGKPPPGRRTGHDNGFLDDVSDEALDRLTKAFESGDEDECVAALFGVFTAPEGRVPVNYDDPMLLSDEEIQARIDADNEIVEAKMQAERDSELNAEKILKRRSREEQQKEEDRIYKEEFSRKSSSYSSSSTDYESVPSNKSSYTAPSTWGNGQKTERTVVQTTATTVTTDAKTKEHQKKRRNVVIDFICETLREYAKSLRREVDVYDPDEDIVSQDIFDISLKAQRLRRKKEEQNVEKQEVPTSKKAKRSLFLWKLLARVCIILSGGSMELVLALEEGGVEFGNGYNQAYSKAYS